MLNKIIKTIEHKGIAVRFSVDFDEGEVSLLDKDNSAKQWLFAGRGLEYLNSWLNILEAMQEAVKEGKKLLEDRKKEDGDSLDKTMVSCLDIMEEMKDERLTNDSEEDAEWRGWHFYGNRNPNKEVKRTKKKADR
jgi:hypothetical protein